MGMGNNFENFIEWFKNPLEYLYKDSRAGFIILMISLPLLERYLRQVTGTYENKLGPDFYNELKNRIPFTNDIEFVKKFWKGYRHGLLHQATLKIENVISISVNDNNPEEISYILEGQGVSFIVSPTKLSKKIISIIENDFSNFEAKNSPNHPPARIYTFGTGGSSASCK